MLWERRPAQLRALRLVFDQRLLQQLAQCARSVAAHHYLQDARWDRCRHAQPARQARERRLGGEGAGAEAHRLLQAQLLYRHERQTQQPLLCGTSHRTRGLLAGIAGEQILGSEHTQQLISRWSFGCPWRLDRAHPIVAGFALA